MTFNAYAACNNAECPLCRALQFKSIIPGVIMLSVIVLNVLAFFQPSVV
jgi:hypothetical protein